MPRGKPASLKKFARLREPKPLYRELADTILKKVTTRELVPGERLPREVDLASSLGVGRPSLREALKILQALGVVSIKRGDGIYVSNIDIEEIQRRLSPAKVIPPHHLCDLFEMRKTLESQGAAWAAERGTDDAIAALGIIVDEMMQLVEGVDQVASEDLMSKLASLNKSFHRQLMLCGGNTALISLLDNIMFMIEETMKYRFVTPGRPIHSTYDHQRIWEGVASRNPEQAAKAMFLHIENAEQGAFGPEEYTGQSILMIVKAFEK